MTPPAVEQLAWKRGGGKELYLGSHEACDLATKVHSLMHPKQQMSAHEVRALLVGNGGCMVDVSLGRDPVPVGFKTHTYGRLMQSHRAQDGLALSGLCGTGGWYPLMKSPRSAHLPLTGLHGGECHPGLLCPRQPAGLGVGHGLKALVGHVG